MSTRFIRARGGNARHYLIPVQHITAVEQVGEQWQAYVATHQAPFKISLAELAACSELPACVLPAQPAFEPERF